MSAASSSSSISVTPGNVCPIGSLPITNWPSCRAALSSISIDGYMFNFPVEESADWPTGCYQCDNVPNCADGVWFNSNPVGAANGNASIICSTERPLVSLGGTLFVGDSDIDHWNTNTMDNSQMLTVLPSPVYNVGYGGYTCQDVLQEAEAMISTFQPDTVVLVCGENDLAMGTSVAATFQVYTEVVETYLAAGTRHVYSFSTKPEPATLELHPHYQELDALIKTYAYTTASESGQTNPPLIFIDSYTGFEARGNPDSLYQADQLHLSEAGYALWEQWLTIAVVGNNSNENGNAAGCAVYASGECVEEKVEQEQDDDKDDDDDDDGIVASDDDDDDYDYGIVASDDDDDDDDDGIVASNDDDDDDDDDDNVIVSSDNNFIVASSSILPILHQRGSLLFLVGLLQVPLLFL